jgi:PKHD-type hydroxylase
MLDTYHYSWESIVPAEICDAIVKSIDWDCKVSGKIGSPTDGTGTENAEFRDTNIVWQDQLSVAGCILKSFMDMSNHVAGWNYEYKLMETVQIGQYKEKGHYTWHRDTANPFNGVQRKLSGILLLNDPSEFEGGKLEFRDVPSPELKKGSVIVFPSFLEHRVTPVTSGVRYTAVSWVVGPTFK